MSAESSSIVPAGTWLVDDEASLLEFELECVRGLGPRRFSLVCRAKILLALTAYRAGNARAA